MKKYFVYLCRVIALIVCVSSLWNILFNGNATIGNILILAVCVGYLAVEYLSFSASQKEKS